MIPTPRPFDLRRFGDVAAVIVRNASEVLNHRTCLGVAHTAALFQASRLRGDVWSAELSALRDIADAGRPLAGGDARVVVRATREILASEMVTRLWACVLTAHESRHRSRVAPLARRLFDEHLRCRSESLWYLTHPTALPAETVDELDALRRRAERWTDCLLAALPARAGMAMLGDVPAAFDAGRCRDFAEDAGHWQRVSGDGTAWHLSELSLRVGIPDGGQDDLTRGRIHREVLEAIAAVIEVSRRVPELRQSRLRFRDFYNR